MTKSLFVFLLFLTPYLLSGQTNFDKKIDSLKNIKSNTQAQIRNLQVELGNINKKIEDLENLKKNQGPINTISAQVSAGGSILRDAPNSMGNTVLNIPAGANIQVYREQQNLYFKVSYGGKTGYVSYSTIEQNNEIDNYLSGKTSTPKNNSTTAIVRKVDESDPKYQKLKKLYGQDTAIRLMNSELWTGMSPGMVLESIGKPNSKQTQTNSSGNVELWIYNDVTVEFSNGEVTKYNKK